MGLAEKRLVLATAAIGLVMGSALGTYVGAMGRRSQAQGSVHRSRVKALRAELHRLERDVVVQDAMTMQPCPTELTRSGVSALLRELSGKHPSSSEVDRFRKTAMQLRVCDEREVRTIHADAERNAAVDTAWHVLTGGVGEPALRFRYLVWLSRGMSIEAVARDIAPNPLAPLSNDELVSTHRQDLEEVARRTRTLAECDRGLQREAAEAFLEAQLGYTPLPRDLELFVNKANGLGVCSVDQLRTLFADRVASTVIDVVFRIQLGRRVDPLGRLIYGVWLTRGVGIERIARDVMTSQEYETLRRVGER